MTKTRRAAGLAALIAALAAPLAGAAGHLQVGGTLIELNPGANAGRFSLSNSGDAPIGVQARVYAWVQVGNEDRLSPTRALVLSPPIATIAPGASQLVRVVATGPLPLANDQAYRVVVEELPGSEESGSSTIAIRMRYIVPLYVRSGKARPPALACGIVTAQAAPKASLSCTNAGGQAAQLGASRLTGLGSPYELTPGLLGYVLPGSRRSWDLDPTRAAALGRAIALETHVNGLATTLALTAPP